MNKYILSTIAVLTTLGNLSLLHAGTPEQEQAIKSAHAWRTFQSPEGDFSIEVPGQLTTKSTTFDDPSGRLNRLQYAVVADLVSYTVGRSDYAAGVSTSQPLDNVFQAYKEQQLAKTKGRLLDESAITLDGARGIELRLEMQDGNIIARCRTYVLGDSVYAVMVVTSPSLISSPAVERFFSSFRLIAKP